MMMMMMMVVMDYYDYGLGRSDAGKWTLHGLNGRRHAVEYERVYLIGGITRR